MIHHTCCCSHALWLPSLKLGVLTYVHILNVHNQCFYYSGDHQCAWMKVFIAVCRWTVSEEMLRLFWGSWHQLPQEILPSPWYQRQCDQRQRAASLWRQDPRIAEYLDRERGHKSQPKWPSQSITWVGSKANSRDHQGECSSPRSLHVCEDWGEVNYFLKRWSEEHHVWCGLCTESLCTIHDWLAHCTTAHSGLLAGIMTWRWGQGRVEVLNYKKCFTSCFTHTKTNKSVSQDRLIISCDCSSDLDDLFFGCFFFLHMFYLFTGKSNYLNIWTCEVLNKMPWDQWNYKCKKLRVTVEKILFEYNVLSGSFCLFFTCSIYLIKKEFIFYFIYLLPVLCFFSVVTLLLGATKVPVCLSALLRA